MEASSLPPELAAELTALRRRAYGPGGDIAADPDALQRLAALESAAHRPPDPPRVGTSADTAARVRRWRLPSLRRRRVAVAALLLVVTGGAGLAVAQRDAGPPPMVATGAQRQDLVDRVDLAEFGMVGAHLQPFTGFHSLWVWSATSAAGETCLLVGAEDGGALGVACAAAAARISLSLQVGTHVRPDLVGDLAHGSTVRFTMSEDTVSVAVAPTPPGEG